ncbi:aminopeptidase P family protein [Haloferax mediterranei ATCC 33500]|uniref:Peptidase n=1 Tax=Haloferax mediterranei (strain ATCC 33500 / DSM 1411 / JCM 8866 / NBRC 14739 / NCIMB 2177 / R-4) TaxID=523841 RepID=I3R3A4_HALMT|nr:Xaa-Pro peptidase family protein [Haloferax mediterranei]AFK18714.1 putative X-Pro dipeptidase [Haloferax mediterranei ATCC 33500]AHZ21918.1 peptidase [Haloferax mediterranei ATCC 33500]EMA03426.1 putative X-Pro dipeptidase [Haloferax mediterranei ATCC 33500]MDX5988810.1 Xaa-Pro peptidase family protein [Haloferax mediterranei ATCC 33500]QCQ75213.1 aminopeptidase P family protein [Haloferax mediterranei ATCC 33500]
MTPFERRTRACQERLAADDTDAVVLFPSRNLLYLSGFDEEPAERHLLLFVPRDGEPVFLVPDLYETQVRAESWVADVRTWSDDEDPLVALESIVFDLELDDGRILVDDTMWARFTQDLRAILPTAEFDLASDVIAPLRVQKDDEELDALRRAGAVADCVVDRIRDMGEDAIGMTETELASEIEQLLAEEGGEGIPFGPLVGSGPNGAMPHHSHGDRVIESGDPVILDFGTRVDHYPSDQTRTVVFDGEPPEGFEEVHEIVQAARTAAVDVVEPGVTAGDVDHAAREVIEDAGYGDRFIHRTGHGVGLDVHEEPYIVSGSDRELEVGNVFSIEPGIYLPDEFGVRIEDLVVVTDDGAELLNDTDRGWRV